MINFLIKKDVREGYIDVLLHLGAAKNCSSIRHILIFTHVRGLAKAN